MVVKGRGIAEVIEDLIEKTARDEIRWEISSLTLYWHLRTIVGDLEFNIGEQIPKSGVIIFSIYDLAHGDCRIPGIRRIGGQGVGERKSSLGIFTSNILPRLTELWAEIWKQKRRTIGVIQVEEKVIYSSQTAEGQEEATQKIAEEYFSDSTQSRILRWK